MSFSRPRDPSCFSAAACLFFDLQLFSAPQWGLEKEHNHFATSMHYFEQSFPRPRNILQRIPDLFSNPKRSFFWTSGAFFDLCRRDAYTRRDEKQIANQNWQIRKQKTKLGQIIANKENKSKLEKVRQVRQNANKKKKSGYRK